MPSSLMYHGLGGEREMMEKKYKVLEQYVGTLITYKELCQLLEWEYQDRGNNSKKAQFKELSRHCKFEEVGRGKGKQYMIIELYKEVLDKIDKRELGNTTKYGMDIETTIMYVLNQHKTDHMYVSCGKALELAHIVNENYRLGRREIPLTSKALGVEQIYLFEFYNKFNQELIRIFERGLKYMRSRCCIMWNKVTIVAREKVDIKYNEMNEPVVKRGKVVYDIKTVHTVATKEERRIITKAEKEVLKNMGYTSLKEVFVSKQWKTFKDRVEAIIMHKANIKYYYEGYDIVLNKEGIAYDVSLLEAENSRVNTNKAIVDKVDKSVLNKASKVGIDKGLDLLDNMGKLTDTLIDTKCEVKLSDEIERIKTTPPKEEQLSFDDELPF